MDKIAEAIDQVSREVQAARRDVGMTSFCLQQAEALRRIDRAKPALLIWCSPGTAKTNTRKATEPNSAAVAWPQIVLHLGAATYGSEIELGLRPTVAL
jgi:hypothetical protein